MREISHAHIDVTGQCNLKCKYCYNYGSSSKEGTYADFTAQEIISLIDHVGELGCKSITFSGGEPFLRNDIFDILNYCRIPKKILSNGLFLTDAKIQKLESVENLEELRITLDGFKGHDRVRGKGTSTKIIKIIEKISQRKQIRLSINTIISRYNINELIKLYDKINKWNIYQWRIDLPFKAGRYIQNYRALCSNYTKTFKELSHLLTAYLKKQMPPRLEIINVFKPELLNADLMDFSPSTHPCEYNLGSCSIRANGDVTLPCPSLFKIFGNVRKVPLRQIIASKSALQFEKIKISDLSKCPTCRYVRLCGGGCRADAYLAYGDLKREDPVSCETMPLFEKLILPVLPVNVRQNILKNLFL